jgi:uncharacterized alpha-E superfamily protein
VTELLGTDDAPVAASQPARQMLARVADSMYWLSRYMERSEHLSRLIQENLQLLTDVGDLSPKLKHELWGGILRICGVDQLPAAVALLAGPQEQIAHAVSAFMTLDPANPNSLLTCIVNARENARSIRENISGEIWEDLNTLYWSLQGAEGTASFEESPLDVYRQAINGSMLFQGLTDQTLAHTQGWLFMQLGKRFERVDMTCRIIEVKFEILQKVESTLEAAERNIHLMSVLRSCASLEAFRRMHVGEMDPMRVAGFIVLERHFPRSVRACVYHAHDAVSRIRAGINSHGTEGAERILGRLNTQLEYADGQEILAVGLPAYLQSIRLNMAQAAESVRKTYFLH